MGRDSKIEWTHHTANMWWGCSKVHTGCKNCYAENLSEGRFNNGVWGDKSPRKMIKSFFSDLRKYQNEAIKTNEVSRVFVGSMMDVFEESRSLQAHDNKVRYTNTGQLRKEFFHRINSGAYSHLVFLLLTKRPENILEMIPRSWLAYPPENVWFGTSISTSSHVNHYVDRLVNKTPLHANRFLSVEPQLDEIKNIDLSKIDWLIQGGESGDNKRGFNLEWAYTMKEICKEQNVPYFFKQVDKVREVPKGLMVRDLPSFI